jgi:transcriptional regulator with XRE-family HTH domain
MIAMLSFYRAGPEGSSTMKIMGRRTPRETGADHFGRHLKALRKGRGWTQLELADRLGIERSIIGNYERGVHYPPVPTLVKLAQALEVSLDRLLSVDQHEVDEIQDRRLYQLFIQVDRMDAGIQGLVKQVVEKIVMAPPSGHLKTGTRG